MKRTLIPLVLILSLGVAVFAAAPESETRDAKPAATPDHEIGLSKESVFEVPTPPPLRERASDPGEEPVLPRSHPRAPALVPHGIADMLPLTRDSNLCLDCHLPGEKVEGEPTPLPKSHLTDLRRAPGEVGEEVAGARFNCMLCHVAPGDAAALVGNRF